MKFSKKIILQYHSFNFPSVFTGTDRSHIDPSTFESHIKHIAKYEDFIITFDDGSPTIFEVAFPLLKQYKLNAIIFIDTAGLDKTRMSVSNVKEMSKEGITFQSHSNSHRNHYKLSEKEIIYEGQKSKEIIENITNETVDKYAFPGGAYSKNICDILSNVGYKDFFTSDYGLKTKVYPKYNIHDRINIHADKSLQYFIRKDIIFLNKRRTELSKIKQWLI